MKAHKAPKRVCMVYTNLNDTYYWTVDPTSCPRKIKPGIGMISHKISVITFFMVTSIFFKHLYNNKFKVRVLFGEGHPQAGV